MSEPETTSVPGNQNDTSYQAFVRALHARFTANVEKHGPLFTTKRSALWEDYLDSIPADLRQFNDCGACRHFVERFGGLVTISAKGKIESALWHPDDAPDLFKEGVARMRKSAACGGITGVFLHGATTLGIPKTGAWTHLSATLPVARVSINPLHTPGRLMAEKREDFKNVSAALSSYSAVVTTQMMRILDADALYQAEKVMGPAKWFHELVILRKNTRSDALFQRLLWRAVALAPPGFAHVRSSMTGTLLDDIAAGLPFDDIAKKFAAKMAPLKYARPQAPPSLGNIQAAERIVAKLGIARSLERRFCRPEEVRTFWRPSPKKDATPREGVFSHLIPKNNTGLDPVDLPDRTLTWIKFRNMILPSLERLEVELEDRRLSIITYVTAANPDAPPILQWDHGSARNPVSWYLYINGSMPGEFRLEAKRYLNVWGVSEHPSRWEGPRVDHFGKGVVLLIEGAADTKTPSACLFPEILKPELREIRSTIEAFSLRAKLAGEEDPHSAGLLVGESGARGAKLRGWTQDGASAIYEIDRWD